MEPRRSVIDFRTPPAPLTPLQRRIVWIVGILAGLTRVWALSRSMWEWDEALFCMGVREYDVTIHHPHPPGYPLFIGAAKLLRFVLHSDFRAVQAVTLLGALALFPLVFLLARELRFSFEVSLGGALVFVFAPNVWYYGGTAFSDVPGLAMLLAACVFLLRGCRDGRSYLLGALLLGLAAGVRPQSLIGGLVPALLATWYQVRVNWTRLLAAILLGVTVIAVIYGIAALSSESPRGFVDAVKGQQDYLNKIDSYHNPGRPALKLLVRPFFVKAFAVGRRTGRIVMILAALAVLASLFRKHSGVWLLLGIFVPLNVFAWLMLDIAAVTRYAVGYAAMYAILAAYALDELTRLLRLPSTFSLLPSLALAISLAIYAYPAIQTARTTSAPNAAIMEWVRKHVDPKATRVFASGGLGPFTAYYLEGTYDVTYVDREDALPELSTARESIYLNDHLSNAKGAINVERPHGRIWNIARQRYFEASVAPVSATARFGDGWWDAEGTGGNEWRWMSDHGVITLPAVPSPARLSLTFDVPLNSVDAPPTLSVTVNGQQVGTAVCDKPTMSLSWTVQSKPSGANVITLHTDKVANPKKLGRGDDSRDLGLRLTSYSWGPAR